MNAPKDPRAEHRPPPLRSAKPRSDAAPVAGSKPSPLPLVLLGAALGTVAALIVLAGLAAGIWLWRSATGTKSPDIASAEPRDAEPVPPPPDEKPQIVVPTPEAVYDPTELLPEEIRKQAREQKPAPEGLAFAPPTQTAPQEPPKPKRPPVFEDILKRQSRLELPTLTPTKISAFERSKLNTTPQKLAKLYVDDVKQCKLQIEGQEFASRGGSQYRIDFGEDDGVPTWNLVSEVETGLKMGPSTWAAFQLKGEDLWFGWKTQPPLRLQLCKLAITVRDETQRCRLTSVEKGKAIQPDQAPAKPIALKSLETTYREGDDVRVELHFHGIEGAAFQGKRMLKIGDTDTVRMTNPHVTPEMGDSTVEIDVSLAQSSPGQKPHLLAEVVAWPEREAKTGGYEKVKHPLTATTLSEWQNTLQALAAKRAEETLGKLEREKRSKWIRLPAEKRQRALAYQELDEQAKKLALDEDETGKVKVNRLLKKMDESPREIKDAVSEFGLGVQGRLDQLRQYEQAVSFVSAKQAWCDAMEKFQQELYNTGRLEYRVYMETTDGPMDLEMTEGFVPKPPKPKPM